MSRPSQTVRSSPAPSPSILLPSVYVHAFWFPMLFLFIVYFPTRFLYDFPPPQTNRLLIATNWFGEIIAQNTPYVNVGLPSKIFSTVNQTNDRPLISPYEKTNIQGSPSARTILSQFSPVHPITVAFVFFFF